MRPFRLVQLAVALLVVAFVVVRSHPGDVWRTVRHADLAYAGAAVILNVPVLMLTPIRSALVYRKLGLEVPVRLLVPTTVLGFVAGGLTPAASGELLRAHALRTRAGVSLDAGLAAVVYERGLALYYLAVSAAIVAALRLDSTITAAALAGGAVLCVLPWLGATALWRFLPAPEQVGGTSLLSRLLRRLLSMLDAVHVLLRDAGLLSMWGGLSLLMFALIAVQYWLLTEAVGAGLNVGDAWIALGVSTFAGVAALIPLGLGALDGSLAATLDRLGATLEQGGAVAVLVRGVVTLPLLAAALAAYLYIQRFETDRPRAAEAGPGSIAGAP